MYIICNLKKFEKFSILKIPKICNVANSKNLQYGNFEKFAISKILRICQILQFQNKNQMSKIVEFRTITIFQNTAIWKTIKIP